MFTGIIEATGTVRESRESPAGRRLIVDAGSWAHRPALGDSVSINGCCLTIARTDAGPGTLVFDVVPETLAKTTIGGLGVGARVNLEQAATLSTLLGGHLVQGHVDGVGVIEGVRTQGEWRVRIRPPAALMAYVAPKGSIALEGVSLTVADLSPGEGWFEVALIPTTLDKTTLGQLAGGSKVNIECDPIAKTVVHWLTHYAAFAGERRA